MLTETGEYVKNKVTETGEFIYSRISETGFPVFGVFDGGVFVISPLQTGFVRQNSTNVFTRLEVAV